MAPPGNRTVKPMTASQLQMQAQMLAHMPPSHVLEMQLQPGLQLQVQQQQAQLRQAQLQAQQQLQTQQQLQAQLQAEVQQLQSQQQQAHLQVQQLQSQQQQAHLQAQQLQSQLQAHRQAAAQLQMATARPPPAWPAAPPTVLRPLKFLGMDNGMPVFEHIDEAPAEPGISPSPRGGELIRQTPHGFMQLPYVLLPGTTHLMDRPSASASPATATNTTVSINASRLIGDIFARRAARGGSD